MKVRTFSKITVPDGSVHGDFYITAVRKYIDGDFFVNGITEVTGIGTKGAKIERERQKRVWFHDWLAEVLGTTTDSDMLFTPFMYRPGWECDDGTFCTSIESLYVGNIFNWTTSPIEIWELPERINLLAKQEFFDESLTSNRTF